MSGKITTKQAKFAKLLAEGMPQVEAYREVYDSSGNPNTQRVEAHRVATNPNVAPIVERERAHRERAEQRSARSRSGWIIERLVGEVEGGDSPSARIRALELLGKASGLFDSGADRESKRQTATELELIAELESRLVEILPGIGIIDAETIDTERAVSEDEKDDPPTPL